MEWRDIKNDMNAGKITRTETMDITASRSLRDGIRMFPAAVTDRVVLCVYWLLCFVTAQSPADAHIAFYC